MIALYDKQHLIQLWQFLINQVERFLEFGEYYLSKILSKTDVFIVHLIFVHMLRNLHLLNGFLRNNQS